MSCNIKSHLFKVIMLATFLSLTGCGDDITNIVGDDPDPLAEAKDVAPESCAICHGGDIPFAKGGAGHQADYEEFYQDQALRVINLAYSNDGTSDIVTFEMTKKNEVTGVEEFFDCRDATSNPEPDVSDALSINFVEYDPATREYSDGAASFFWKPIKGTLTYDGSGGCTSTNPQSTLGDLSGFDGHIAVFGRDETLTADPAKHISSPKFPFATILKLPLAGPVVDYVSNANASGCENCHTRPFLKHTYIYGEVNDGTNNDGNDFYVCKTCHLDQRNGGHEDWQILKDDPVRYAEIHDPVAPIAITPAEEAKYAYKTRLMNDVHMSHNMEFGFPQSMKTCNTCHEGKLDTTITDANFTPETCISCHSIGVIEDDPLEDGFGTYTTGILAKMQTATITFHSTVDETTLKATPCNACHTATLPVIPGAPLFRTIHSGYDPEIYADTVADGIDGTRYSEALTVAVDDTTTFDPATNILTIDFSATEVKAVTGLTVANIEPTVMVGLYAHDTKHWLVGPHGRDFDSNGDGVINRSDERNLEVTVGDTHSRITTVSPAVCDPLDCAWQVTADMSDWADKIADGSVKRVEIGIMPVLDDLNGDEVAMNAPSRTFDLTALPAGAFIALGDPGSFNVVDVLGVDADGGCNSCHDALATTFHSGKRGGNIVICKMCHVPSSGGSHLEMQSRSIDSYVHAIHSFQDFDIGDIDFSDPVEAAEHSHKIKSEFPRFGILNCEACHNPGTYEVPDQSKSLPSVLSASDDVADRNIGTVPSYVVGPASRACGACHRAEMIKDDDAGRLAAFFAHTAANGYLVENDDGVWDTVVETVMAIFK